MKNNLSINDILNTTQMSEEFVRKVRECLEHHMYTMYANFGEKYVHSIHRLKTMEFVDHYCYNDQYDHWSIHHVISIINKENFTIYHTETCRNCNQDYIDSQYIDYDKEWCDYSEELINIPQFDTSAKECLFICPKYAAKIVENESTLCSEVYDENLFNELALDLFYQLYICNDALDDENCIVKFER